MKTALGTNASACFGIEAADQYGVAVPRTLGLRLAQDGDGIIRKSGSKAHPLYGAISNRQRIRARWSTEGPVKFDCTRQGIERILEAVFGSRETAETADAGYYQHSFALSKVVPSITWESSRGVADEVGKALLFKGLKVSKATFSQAADAPLQGNVDLIGDGSLSELDAPTEDIVLPAADYWGLDEVVVKVGGVPIYVDNYELSIDRKPDTDLYQGRTRLDIIPKDVFAITLKFGTVLSDVAYNQIVARLKDEALTAISIEHTCAADAKQKLVWSAGQASIDGEWPLAKNPGKIGFTPSFTLFSTEDEDLQELTCSLTNKNDIA